MSAAVIDLDLSESPGRLFVASDIHGCFTLLDEGLADAGYDPACDILFLIGDLIDRGGESQRCLEWIGRLGCHVLKGNHESYIEGVCDGRISRLDHQEDGGGWFYELNDHERHDIRVATLSLPLAAKVITPRGRRVGMIHADVAGNNFAQFCGHLRFGDYRAEQIAMNGRSRIAAVRQGQQIPLMTDVDHMFFGHSPVTEPVTVGNCSWIDTGLPHSRQLTLIEVDEWIDRH